MQSGNILAELTAKVADWCHKTGTLFAVENPATSRYWDQPSVLRVTSDPRVGIVRLHHCMWGGRRPKHTQLATTCTELNKLGVTCDGEHEHLPWAVE